MFILRQLGHLRVNEIRRFLSPSHGGFSFVGIEFLRSVYNPEMNLAWSKEPLLAIRIS